MKNLSLKVYKQDERIGWDSLKTMSIDSKCIALIVDSSGRGNIYEPYTTDNIFRGYDYKDFIMLNKLNVLFFKKETKRSLYFALGGPEIKDGYIYPEERREKKVSNGGEYYSPTSIGGSYNASHEYYIARRNRILGSTYIQSIGSALCEPVACEPITENSNLDCADGQVCVDRTYLEDPTSTPVHTSYASCIVDSIRSLSSDIVSNLSSCDADEEPPF